MSHHSLTLFSAEFICNSDDFKYFAEANKLPWPVNILNKSTMSKIGKDPTNFLEGHGRPWLV